jgi:hypothetical protein
MSDLTHDAADHLIAKAESGCKSAYEEVVTTRAINILLKDFCSEIQINESLSGKTLLDKIQNCLRLMNKIKNETRAIRRIKELLQTESHVHDRKVRNYFTNYPLRFKYIGLRLEYLRDVRRSELARKDTF